MDQFVSTNLFIRKISLNYSLNICSVPRFCFSSLEPSIRCFLEFPCLTLPAGQHWEKVTGQQSTQISAQLVSLCPSPSLLYLSISLYCPSFLPLSPLLSPLCLCFSLPLSVFSLFLSLSHFLSLSAFLSLFLFVFVVVSLFLCPSFSFSLFFSISLPVSLFSLSVSLSPSQLLTLSLLCLCCPSSMLSLYMHRNLSRYSRVSAVTQVNEQLSFICSAFNLLKVSKILQGQTSYQILQYSKFITQWSLERRSVGPLPWNSKEKVNSLALIIYTHLDA